MFPGLQGALRTMRQPIHDPVGQRPLHPRGLPLAFGPVAPSPLPRACPEEPGHRRGQNQEPEVYASMEDRAPLARLTEEGARQQAGGGEAAAAGDHGCSGSRSNYCCGHPPMTLSGPRDLGMGSGSRRKVSRAVAWMSCAPRSLFSNSERHGWKRTRRVTFKKQTVALFFSRCGLG